MPEADWITLTEASQLVGYSTKQLRRLAQAGRLKARRFGAVWALDRTSVMAYVEAMAEKGPKRGPKGTANQK